MKSSWRFAVVGVAMLGSLTACSGGTTEVVPSPSSTSGTTTSAAPSSPPPAPDPQNDAAIAVATQNEFFSDIKNGDTAGLEEILSPAFQLMRADGSTASKAQYVANPAVMNDFTLTDFVVTRDGDAIVARFMGTTSEIIDGQPYSTAPAPRGSVMVWDGSRWRIVAQMNFSTPQQ